MANSTKGEWKTIKDKDHHTHIMAFDADGYERNVCVLSTRSPEEVEANADLIVAAVNACAKVNPDNLLAAAEALPDMYEALKELAKLREMVQLYGGDYEALAKVIGVRSIDELIASVINKALAKARNEN